MNGDAPPILYSKALKRLLLTVPTKHQILILNELGTKIHYFSVTNLISSLSEKYEIASSTIRWNVNRLRDLGLINCGNASKKGVPVKLTGDGDIVLKIIEEVSLDD